MRRLRLRRHVSWGCRATATTTGPICTPSTFAERLTWQHGALYGLFGGRPNWAPGASSQTAVTNVPAAYYFNPAAFVPAILQPGQVILSAHDSTAIVSPGSQAATDVGDTGRDILRGPRQANLDLSIRRKFSLAESTTLELRSDFFNVLNHPNRDNPISDISTADFGKVVSFSASPRIIQLALRLWF